MNNQFLYLNRENRWRDFQLHGLALAVDGTLQLRALPAALSTLPSVLTDLPAPTAPAGVAVTPSGDVYYTDPQTDQVLKWWACDGTSSPAPCLGGHGSEPAQFDAPRGLLVHPARTALFVADSGNHRIQIFGLEDLQLAGIWGGMGNEPGQLNAPWTLAADGEGSVYVLDYGNQRVQKFNLRGEVIPAFWQNAQTAAQQHNLALARPSDLAVDAGAGRVYVLDSSSARIFVFDVQGNWLASFDQPLLSGAMGMAAADGDLFVGDNIQRRVLVFESDGTLAGEALGYDGPVAALTLDGCGSLWVASGGTDPAPVQLALTGGYSKDGFLWGGPFENPSVRPEQWHWLRTQLVLPEEGAHFQLFVFRGDADHRPAAPSPDSPPWTGSAVDLLDCDLEQADGRNAWVRVPLDAAECLFAGSPLDQIWAGAEFSGEGAASPTLSQLRIDFDHDTYLKQLPAVYQENPRSRHFMARFLTLTESLFAGVESEIRALAALFDPAAAPAAQGGLAWLGQWLALPVSQDWNEAQQRQAIATAFKTYAQRGTPQGLREAVRWLTGVDIHIEEPILQANWWMLPDTAQAGDAGNAGLLLGFNTRLAPAEAQGAVLGSTAVLDGSQLIAPEQAGVPLFENVAHQFTAYVYQGHTYSEQRQQQVRAIIESEKPAHTLFELCVVEPAMRVGYQAQLGIDTIVGGALGAVQPTEGLLLGGEPPATIGDGSRVGLGTRLGQGVMES